MKIPEQIKDLEGKIDKKALAASIGVMLLSWAALPIVYWLIIKKKGKEKEIGKGGTNNG